VIDQEYIKVFAKIAEALPEVKDKVVNMWTWMKAEVYAVEDKNMEDHGEGTSMGEKKRREERKQVVVEDTGSAMDIGDSDEDRDGLEVDEIEEEAVEVQGKGKGKEKTTEKGMEESTLA
jgi:hypothetical protein